MLVREAPLPNPEVIAWARKESGYDVSRVAARLSLQEAQVAGWEGKGKPPTVRQLMNLAALLHRPLSLFFLSDVPSIPPVASEYRRLSGVKPGEESPEFRLAIRSMAGRRDDALDLIEELEIEVPSFSLSATSAENPRAVGARLRSKLAVTMAQQASWKDSWQAWREWRSALEDIGLLVFMFPKVEIEEARGVALLREPVPVVAVNTKEAAESRAFTALHEAVHMMLAHSKEETAALFDHRPHRDLLALERFAETAASHALVPEEELARVVGGRPPTDIGGMRQLAGYFKITPLAAATRLQTSGFLSWPQYHAWRALWDNHIRGAKINKGGFATPVSKTLGRSGRSFSQLVLEAFDRNRITTADAARYLNLRPEHFDELRQRLMKGSTSEVPDE